MIIIYIKNNKVPVLLLGVGQGSIFYFHVSLSGSFSLFF